MSSLTRVRVKQGIVLGCEEKLPNGKSYLRFSGIPYAKPPINELRFKSPQKLLKFVNDEINCKQEGDACFHKSTLTREYVGSEDCLNLNVYVPVQNDPTEKFTVMVYIHGGGLKYDSNSKQLYSPEHLLMENVIVVTVNYRLHILGFLSFPKMGISGNAGLKDQQMALQWVHENIASFHGDPENICLFGESAGAACTHLHVLNEKSRKMIKSAICQSGTAFNTNSFRGNTDKDIQQVANLLGCKGDTLTDAYETLMKAPLKDLYENCEKNPSPSERNLRFRRWRIVIEEESDDAFISKHILESTIEQKGQIKIPVIMGTNDGDGMPKIAENIKKLDELNNDMVRLIPRNFRLNSVELKVLADAMKCFYFNNQDVSEETLPQLKTMFTDLAFLLHQTIGNEFFAQYHPQSKQFLYEFQFDGKLNIQKQLVKLEHLPGACHADDVFYLFGGVLADKVKLDDDSREMKIRRTMCKLWANFAKYLDPTPDHDNPLPFKWTSVQPRDKSSNQLDFDYLVFNDEMKMIRNLNKERMDFWRKVYRRWNKDSFTANSKL